jgi:hypothetical protein
MSLKISCLLSLSRKFLIGTLFFSIALGPDDCLGDKSAYRFLRDVVGGARLQCCGWRCVLLLLLQPARGALEKESCPILLAGHC